MADDFRIRRATKVTYQSEVTNYQSSSFDGAAAAAFLQQLHLDG